MEEIKWNPKAKVQLLKEEDNNTKFFHRMTSTGGNNNSLTRLQIEDIMVEDYIAIKSHIVEIFKQQYADQALLGLFLMVWSSELWKEHKGIG